jgi:hypothetical protein
MPAFASRKNRRFSAIALLALAASIAATGEARAEESCEAKYLNAGAVSAHVMRTRNGKCLLSVYHSRPNSRSRTFVFVDNGSLELIESYGKGRLSDTTGVRSWFFFPRRQKPSMRLLPGGDLEVTTASGDRARFSAASGRMVSLTGAQVRDSGKSDPRLQGGLAIASPRGIRLDAGFRMGGSPYAKLGRQSLLTDSHGNTCLLENTELFERDGIDSAAPRFRTDQQLAEFLSNRCRNPELDVASLVRPQAPAQRPEPQPEQEEQEEEQQQQQQQQTVPDAEIQRIVQQLLGGRDSRREPPPEAVANPDARGSLPGHWVEESDSADRPSSGTARPSR